MSPTLAHNPETNDTRFSDLTKKVTSLGKDAADGKDALPKLAFAVVAAAFDGVIDEDKKHPSKSDPTTKLDDAAVIYAAYKNGEGKKQFSDYTADGDKANISKLRQMVKLGLSPHCDPNAVLVKTLELRDEVASLGNKVLSAYPAMVQVARAQVELDRQITDDEIRDAVQKPAPKETELVDYVKQVAKKLEKLISGEAPGGLQCQDDNVVAAYEKLEAFLTICTKRDAIAKLMREAADMGLVYHEPTSTTPEEIYAPANEEVVAGQASA